MRNKRIMKVSLLLMLMSHILVTGLVIIQTGSVYAQENESRVLNQTDNQTRNLTLSPALPGQQGGTPPKAGPG